MTPALKRTWNWIKEMAPGTMAVLSAIKSGFAADDKQFTEAIYYLLVAAAIVAVFGKPMSAQKPTVP